MPVMDGNEATLAIRDKIKNDELYPMKVSTNFNRLLLAQHMKMKMTRINVFKVDLMTS